MSLMLVHADYNGSSPYPVCDIKKTSMRQDNLVICFDCNKSSIEQDLKKQIKLIPRFNYWASGVLPMACMTIMMILFTIGFGIIYFLQTVRGAVHGMRRHSPDSNLKHNVGLGCDCAGPGSTYPNKSGQNIYYLPYLKNS